MSDCISLTEKRKKPPTAPLQYAGVRAFARGIKIMLNKED